jgi:hypothetical protein
VQDLSVARVSQIPSVYELAALSAEKLVSVDPLILNLCVARELPPLVDLNVRRYAAELDDRAAQLASYLPGAEAEFARSPGDWKNDIDFFHMGLLCWFVDEILGIRYHEDQRDLKTVLYIDPGDLFLHGLIDTRRGTCANMPALHVALAWRLGWPASLACAHWHVFCRFDDGRRTFNIEATKTGGGGFHSHPDAYYCEKYLTSETMTSGGYLQALNPRELLGLFVGFRARHYQDMGMGIDAVENYRLAHHLYPEHALFRKKAAGLGKGLD